MSDSSGISRRGFISGVSAGLGAGAAALTPGNALAAVVNETFTADTAPGNRFGRIFRLPSFAPATDSVRAALSEMGKAGGLLDAKDDLSQGPILLITNPALSLNNRNNPTHTAGTTFLGQFLDHDLTFDTTSKLGVTTKPEDSPNARTPAFDLDSMYGRGPNLDPNLYDPQDRSKFKIGSGGQFEDLQRNSAGKAIIPDPRNDENMMIAGLHVAFQKFHNRVVDDLRARSRFTFAQARRLTTWHYQWIILHEFLPQIVGQAMVDDVLRNGRRFYRPSGAPYIPVEFQGAAYRFGHSMVRPSYRANLKGDNGGPFFGMIFDPAGEGQADPVDLRGGARASRRFIGWQTFFDFGLFEADGVSPAVKPKKRIDTRISTPLFHLPLGTIPSGDAPVSLPQRNLLRGLTWSLPSGQAIAGVMGVPPVDTSELAPYGFANRAPLFYYVLKEAEATQDGLRLGPVGGRIVAEVFIGLMQLDPNAYLRVQPNWTPVLPRKNPGAFTVTDMLTYAKVDPASRSGA